MRYLLALLIALATTAAQAAEVRFFECDDNAANTTVVDSSASAVNGSMQGGNTSTKQLGSGPGNVINNAFTLDGTGDAIYLNTGVTRNNGQAYTFSIWFRKSSFAEHDVLATSIFNDNYHISIPDNATIRFYSNSTNVDFTVSAMAVDEWHHLFVTRAASTNNTRVWVDGVESSSGTQVGAGAMIFLDIGRNTTSAATDFTGDISYIRVFDSDESANVATYYAEGVSAGGPAINPISLSIPGSSLDPIRTTIP